MTGRHARQHNRGAALLIFMILLVMASLTYVVSNLTPAAIEAKRAQKTQETLALARDALLGYALKYREAQAAKDADNAGEDDRAMYGYLPLPDLGSSRNNNIDPNCLGTSGNPLEGCDANTFTGITFDGNAIGPTVIGRFPWRTLGTGPLRDGHGECLWLIVSSLHSRIQGANPVLPPMNWDTLGQLDVVVANGTSALAGALASAHGRPVAILFSPGSPLPGQNRNPSTTDDVGQCGGNYNAANYLDPATAGALGSVTNYLGGTNAATAATGDSDPANDPDTPKQLSLQGKVFTSGGNYHSPSCPGTDCTLVANDAGLAITSEALFASIRKSSNFRTDINTMLERMAGCLRDEIAAGGLPAAYGRVAGADGNACYGKDTDPPGYYPHYREMIFVAAPASPNVSVDGLLQSGCAGALIFAGQRGSGQQRVTAADKAAYANYLEGANLSSFTASGNAFAGAGSLGLARRDDEPEQRGQLKSQDIVRCIPAGASFTSVESAALTAQGIGQLTEYNPATRTLTIGRLGAESDQGAPAHALFGCAWQPESHATGSGLRAYFKFFIRNTGAPGDGFTFALADGDANAANACGAAQQHLGYSGNNGSTPPIAPPKIGIEFDTSRHYRSNAAFTDPTGFNPAYLGATPATNSSLSNGRADPNYAGGHLGIVYWGGESPISTGLACGAGCTYPQYCNAGICYLNPEEDDNVHGRSAVITSTRPPPQNPVAPAIPATPPAGVYKLDPNLSSVPREIDIHVRIELARSQPVASYNSRPVRVVATSHIALNGLTTIDDIALQDGDRVLLTAQAEARLNGVWIAATGAWVRASTEDEVADMPSGTGWIVRAGTANAWTYWQLANPDGYILARTAADSGTALSIGKAAVPWRAVTTAPVTLASLAAIGGIALADGDWVLVTAQATAAENGIYIARAGAWERVPMYRGTVTTRAWLLKDSLTDANRIAKMALVSRPMATLDAGFTELLANTATIYSPQAGACTANAQCSSGQWCGIDNICYRPAFRTLRLGFTNGQGTRDQIIDIKDFATTWLP